HQPSYRGLHRGDGDGREDQPADTRLRIFDVVNDAAGGPSGQNNRHSFQRRSTRSTSASAWLFGSSSQTHHEGKAHRSGLPEGPQTPDPLKKKSTEKERSRSPDLSGRSRDPSPSHV